MKKLTRTFLYSAPIAALATPLLALAQNTDFGGIENAIKDIGDIVNLLLPIVAAIALLAFFFGLAKYIFQADKDEDKAKGKEIMIAGIISLFLIAAIGGIISVLGDIAGVDTKGGSIQPTEIDY